MKNGVRLTLLLPSLYLFAFISGDRPVLAAAPDLANAHFQLMAATVDESELSNSRTPTHKVFLVDSATGRVWRYQPVFVDTGADGVPKVLSPEEFVPVPVLPPKQ